MKEIFDDLFFPQLYSFETHWKIFQETVQTIILKDIHSYKQYNLNINKLSLNVTFLKTLLFRRKLYIYKYGKKTVYDFLKIEISKKKIHKNRFDVKKRKLGFKQLDTQ